MRHLAKRQRLVRSFRGGVHRMAYPSGAPISAGAPGIFNLKQLAFITCGHVINTIAQLLNALGVFEVRLSIYIFGLLWLLFHGAFQFGRILFVQPLRGGAVSRGLPLESEDANKDRATSRVQSID
jgi:hypothetical protein